MLTIDDMINEAERNFQKTKEYANYLLEEKRRIFLEEFKK